MFPANSSPCVAFPAPARSCCAAHIGRPAAGRAAREFCKIERRCMRAFARGHGGLCDRRAGSNPARSNWIDRGAGAIQRKSNNASGRGGRVRVVSHPVRPCGRIRTAPPYIGQLFFCSHGRLGLSALIPGLDRQPHTGWLETMLASAADVRPLLTLALYARSPARGMTRRVRPNTFVHRAGQC